MRTLNVFDTSIKCIDAGLRASVETAEGGDILSSVDKLIADFKDKYEITTRTVDADDSPDEAYTADRDEAYSKLEHDIMIAVWEHIQECMLGTGMGEIAREVMASELFDIKTSWDKKE